MSDKTLTEKIVDAYPKSIDSETFAEGFGEEPAPLSKGQEFLVRAIMAAGPDVVVKINAELDKLDPKREHRSF